MRAVAFGNFSADAGEVEEFFGGGGKGVGYADEGFLLEDGVDGQPLAFGFLVPPGAESVVEAGMTDVVRAWRSCRMFSWGAL